MKAITLFLPVSKHRYFAAMALSLFFTTAISYAGSGTAGNTVASINNQLAPTGDWVLDKTVSNVDFYHAVNVCNGKNTVFLKFVNRNANAVKISWKEIFVTAHRERIEGFAGRKEMVIQPGTTTPADCNDATNKKAIIRGSEIDPMAVVDIVNFSYKDITVAVQ